MYQFELVRVLVPAAALLARARDLAQRFDRLGVLAVRQPERLREQAQLGGVGVGERQPHGTVPALERDHREAEARSEDQLAEWPFEFLVVGDHGPVGGGACGCEERRRHRVALAPGLHLAVVDRPAQEQRFGAGSRRSSASCRGP